MPLDVKLGHFPGGYPYVEILPTLETDPTKVLAPDGSGGVAFVPGGLGGGMVTWGNFNIGVTEAGLYLAPGYDAIGIATANPIELRVPRAGTFRNLYVRHNLIYGAPTETIYYTLLVNGALTTLQVGIVLPAQDGNDQVHSVICAKGDRVSLLITKSVLLAAGGPFGVIATAEFV